MAWKFRCLTTSWTLIRRHHHLGTLTIIIFNCVRPFFLVPQGFTWACQVSSTSHKELIPSGNSLLGFPLREQSSEGHGFVLLPERVVAASQLRVTPARSSGRAWPVLHRSWH